MTLGSKVGISALIFAAAASALPEKPKHDYQHPEPLDVINHRAEIIPPPSGDELNLKSLVNGISHILRENVEILEPIIISPEDRTAPINTTENTASYTTIGDNSINSFDRYDKELLELTESFSLATDNGYLTEQITETLLLASPNQVGMLADYNDYQQNIVEPLARAAEKLINNHDLHIASPVLNEIKSIISNDDSIRDNDTLIAHEKLTERIETILNNRGYVSPGQTMTTNLLETSLDPEQYGL